MLGPGFGTSLLCDIGYSAKILLMLISRHFHF